VASTLHSYFGIQALYLDESATSQNTLAVLFTASVRNVMGVSDTYPHNAVYQLPFPRIPIGKLLEMPLSELALAHRQVLLENRNVSFVQAHQKWLEDEMGGDVMFVRPSGVDSWNCSNQTLAGAEKIDFGSEMKGFWQWSFPFDPDHTIIINEFKGGVLFKANIRRSRWISVENEVKRMIAGEPRRVV